LGHSSFAIACTCHLHTTLLLGIVEQTVKQALKEDVAREMTFFLTTAFARRKLVFELDE
jgi:hypothetical protein